VTRWSRRLRARDPAAIDRAAFVLLALAMVAAAALLLWLNRGTTLFRDELHWFADLSGYTGLSSVFEPHNNHLHGTTRTIYWLSMETLGFDYLIFRILGVVAVLLSSGLFFLLVRRRVGPVVSLALAVLLLFLGSAWHHVVGPIGFTVLISIAGGLGALLALERNDRRGDAAACALLCFAVFSFSVGVAFLAGATTLVLLGRDRLRRAWVFSIPLVLYGSWWLWSQQFESARPGPSIDKIENVVPFFGESVAVVAGALTGVNIPFSRFGDVAGISVAPASALGWIVAAAFVAALLWRISRGNVPTSLWASLAILATYWGAAALSDPEFFGRQATAVRYVYPGSIGLLLIATDAARDRRIPRAATAALLMVVAFSLVMNIVFLRDGAAHLRAFAVDTRARLAAIELGQGATLLTTEGTREPFEAGDETFPFGPSRSGYLASAGEYGSPAFTLEQLKTTAPRFRAVADTILIDTYAPRIVPASGPTDDRACEASAAGPQGTPLPPDGTYLRPRGGAGPVSVALARFGEGAQPDALGTVAKGGWSELRIPVDEATEPWRIYPREGRQLLLCPLS
jgi:hypothetical protein